MSSFHTHDGKIGNVLGAINFSPTTIHLPSLLFASFIILKFYVLSKIFPAGLFVLSILFNLCFSSLKAQNTNEPLLPFLINEYSNDVADLNRVYIFPFSEEYFNRFEQLHAMWTKKMQAIDFDKLEVSAQVDYLLQKRNIENDQYELAQNKTKFEQVSYAVPFAHMIMDLQKKRRRGTTPDAGQWAASLSQVKNEIQKAKTIIAKTPIQNNALKSVVNQMIRDLRAGLQSVHSFYNGYNPEYSWWMQKTYPETDSALASFASWIAAQPVAEKEKALDNSGIIGHQEGREEMIRLLKSEMIAYTPEELVTIAEQQYAWCQDQMIKVSEQMGFKKDWKSALEQVKLHSLRPGEQPALINRLQEEAISFIDSLDLVTIPALSKELWRMDMLSVQMMKFASYFLGGAEILIAYPHADQDFETKNMIMRSGNYGFAHAEVFHELIPGHNLQHFMFKRYKTYRRPFNSPFSTEGWPFYWEMLLWDKGFNKTNDEKAGALFWRMTRCARIVFSLNYHLGRWTPQQCIDYLVEKVGLEPFSAESEVRRSFTGGYGPLYQLAYMTGALQMYSLHQELVGSAKMTNKQFNDAYLHNGNIPIEMLRAILLNKKLKKNYTTEWKFNTH